MANGRPRAESEEDAAVFRALADPSRRRLLDALDDRDGQTLAELTTALPSMTRFGVMKHLAILEAAGLVTTRKVGREKHHHLNRVPIRLVHDRWIDKFTEPIAGRLARLKRTLEEPMPDAGPTHVFTVHVRATPEQVWEAFSRNDLVGQWCHSVHYEPDDRWEVGATILEKLPDGRVVAEIEVLELDLHARWSVRVTNRLGAAHEADPPYRQTWELDPMGEAVRITVTCDGFPEENATYRLIGGGMRSLLDGLKTLLETGRPLALR